MNKIATFLLLVALVASALPSNAQFTSPEENARQSRAAAKQQQKAMKKSARKQQKAMRKYQKNQRKAVRHANRHRPQ
ncbi:MAG TPA: hypothetical protein VGV15_00985 [Terriglobales bacterium]|nr:hypothetical protein [Terriglobales bacterium]